jgi:hypothetical protein
VFTGTAADGTETPSDLEALPDGLKAATFGDSSKVAVGRIVLAMGSPLGLSSSLTQGIVSATGRIVSESGDEGGTGATIANMVQTSAAINPGSSGGALVNLDGQVIGIPTLAAVDPTFGDSAAPGTGFAIPASMVRTVADQIIRDGKVTDSGRAALGITGAPRTRRASRPGTSSRSWASSSGGGRGPRGGPRPARSRFLCRLQAHRTVDLRGVLEQPHLFRAAGEQGLPVLTEPGLGVALGGELLGLHGRLGLRAVGRLESPGPCRHASLPCLIRYEEHPKR